MITGPVKFKFKTGDVDREALAFWCVMMPRAMFEELGLLDEIFSPGMGEDGDFCIKAVQNGHQLVQVPIDGTHEFGGDPQEGIVIPPLPWKVFPIMHHGSGTFGWLDAGGLIERNKKILDDRYGESHKKVNMPKYSIIIPTYNHCEDLLKPCLESIKQYTDLSTVEVLVVANGCTDNTKEYVQGLGDPFQLIWMEEAAGYTKATNVGIKAATGEYVVLLNNDTVLLDQPVNKWLELLEAPFVEKQSMGLTGPLELYDNYANAPVLIFFCVMIKRSLFETIGYLDEAFTPGGGEDIDFTVRARLAGYDAQVLEPTVNNGYTNVGSFPIWHKNNQTFVEMPEYTNWIVKRNGLINCKRYNKNIKLNLGAGGVEYPGYLSVDLHDKRANILMDITHLDFEENTVTEILASHVFEHLNPYHAFDILVRWNKILKPGGRLVMEMPNIEELCRRFVSATKAERYGILNAVYGCVNTTNVGGQDEITSPHLFGWWPEALWEHLVGAGYVDIEFMAEKIPHPESNFRVECMKPVRPDHTRLQAEEPLIYAEVFSQDNYKVDNVKGKTVVDCGANVGYFTLKCAEMGAKHVLAVEAQPTIYNLGLLRNVDNIATISTLNRALGAVDNQTVTISNNHVASKVGEPGETVQTISLSTLFNMVEGNDIHLKMDIEGSEFDVLLNTPDFVLRRCETIYIEIHGDNCHPDYSDPDVARNALLAAGFSRVYSVQQYGGALDEKGSIINPTSMNIFVEKWNRNA